MGGERGERMAKARRDKGKRKKGESENFQANEREQAQSKRRFN